MKKIIIFASGSGSNAEKIILHFQDKAKAKVVAVFCNNAQAMVIERAKNLKVPVVVFTKKELEENTVCEKMALFNPDLIVLAGFLLKIPKTMISTYPNKIINIHPALLPKYGGKGMYGENVHRAVLENQEKTTGITIHFVNEEYDEGNTIFQKETTITDCKTPQEIAQKVHQLEHEYFSKVMEELLSK